MLGGCTLPALRFSRVTTEQNSCLFQLYHLTDLTSDEAVSNKAEGGYRSRRRASDNVLCLSRSCTAGTSSRLLMTGVLLALHAQQKLRIPPTDPCMQAHARHPETTTCMKMPRLQIKSRHRLDQPPLTRVPSIPNKTLKELPSKTPRAARRAPASLHRWSRQ